ncbi:MAG TPA: hypothetical protein VEA80_12110 [Vitreimonas sp.]|uniref:hypothetical protein n=1 Tax=Vitreimonas sp. TaxID=3069702 RepID=UPI002D3E1857|nr:hypothetical protein [Vitreimonas sp.]HYD88215.1 hypothetical protein [Vitreimonas sp.]
MRFGNVGAQYGGDAVAHDPEKDHPSSRTAEELARAAARAESAERRLWRLQWAQAFKRLSELGGRKGEDRDTR